MDVGPSDAFGAGAAPVPAAAVPAPPEAARAQPPPSSYRLGGALQRRTTIVECAVSLRFLKDLARDLVWEGATTEEVKNSVVMPYTKAGDTNWRYVEHPSLVPPEHVGWPTYFISHTWTGLFRPLVEAVSNYLADEIDTNVFVWVDMFAVNQHFFKEDLGNLQHAIQSSSGGTLVVLGVEGVPLSRVWCLYEFANTVLLKGPDSLKMMLEPGVTGFSERLGKVVLNIDIESAKATRPEDGDLILGAIVKEFGSYPPFNSLLKMLLLLQPLDYSVDLNSLLERSGHCTTDSCGAVVADSAAPIWDLCRFATWLRQAQALLASLTGGEEEMDTSDYGQEAAGSEAADQPASEDRQEEEDDEVEGHETPSVSESAASEGGGSYPFARNQVDADEAGSQMSGPCRQKLAAVVLTAGAGEGKSTVAALLVAAAGGLQRYQLAAKGSTGATVKAVVSDPLSQPIPIHAWHFFKYNNVRRQDTTQVIKTLAYQLGTCPDLPELQTIYRDRTQAGQLQPQQFQDSDALFDKLLRAPLEDYAQLPGRRLPIVVLFDALDETQGDVGTSGFNEMMHLLCEQCATLLGVYFIMTIRDGPEHGHLVARLRRTFHLTVLRAASLQDSVQLHQHIVRSLTASRGEAKGWTPSTAAEGGEVAARLVLLAHQSTAAPADSAAALSRGGLPASVAPAAQHAFCVGDTAAHSVGRPTTPSMVYLTVCVELLLRGMVSPLHLPTTLDEAYSIAFMGVSSGAQSAAEPEAGSGSRAVTKLLEILVAAREPLSPTQLQLLGVDHMRPMLPLLGVLFFQRDMRMYLLHSSLHEFLAQTQAHLRGDAPRINMAAGHCVLAQASHTHQQLTGALNSVAVYGMRHMVAHACLADAPNLLSEVLLDLDCWEATYNAGSGPLVFSDLVRLAAGAPSQCAALMADVLRWLRSNSSYLVKHPRAAWQLARDAPHNSRMAQRAAREPSKATAQLLNKDDDWNACLATHEHESDLPVVALAITPDGRTVVCATGERVQIWDLAQGELRHVLDGHTGDVSSVVISRDGTIIVSGSDDETVRMWDLLSGVSIRAIKGHTDAVNGVAITQSGNMIASGSDDTTVRLWNADTGELVTILDGHPGEVLCVAFSFDGQAVVAGLSNHFIWVWDISAKADCQCRHVLCGHKGAVKSVVTGHDLSIMVSSSADDTIRVWDIVGNQSVHVLKSNAAGVTNVALSSNATCAMAGFMDGSVMGWDIITGKCVATFIGHGDEVDSVAISCDGRSVVSSAQDGFFRVWDLASAHGQSQTERYTHQTVTCVAISWDGTTAVSGAEDFTVRVWDVASSKCLHALLGHKSPVLSVHVSPDGKLAASCTEEQAAACKRRARGGHQRPVGPVRVTKVWDVMSGGEQPELKGDDAWRNLLASWIETYRGDCRDMDQRFARSSDGGEVLHIETVKGKHLPHLAPIYLLPPHIASEAKGHVSLDETTMVALHHDSGRVLFYRLG